MEALYGELDDARRAEFERTSACVRGVRRAVRRDARHAGAHARAPAARSGRRNTGACIASGWSSGSRARTRSSSMRPRRRDGGPMGRGDTVWPPPLPFWPPACGSGRSTHESPARRASETRDRDHRDAPGGGDSTTGRLGTASLGRRDEPIPRRSTAPGAGEEAPRAQATAAVAGVDAATKRAQQLHRALADTAAALVNSNRIRPQRRGGIRAAQGARRATGAQRLGGARRLSATTTAACTNWSTSSSSSCARSRNLEADRRSRGGGNDSQPRGSRGRPLADQPRADARRHSTPDAAARTARSTEKTAGESNEASTRHASQLRSMVVACAWRRHMHGRRRRARSRGDEGEGSPADAVQRPPTPARRTPKQAPISRSRNALRRALRAGVRAARSFSRSTRRASSADEASFWKCYALQRTTGTTAIRSMLSQFSAAYPDGKWADDARTEYVKLAKRMAKAGDPRGKAALESLRDSTGPRTRNSSCRCCTRSSKAATRARRWRSIQRTS